MPFSGLNLWADRKVLVCCQDWNEERVVGDVNTQSLAEIWRSERMTEVRRLHMEKRGHEVSLRAKCDYWVKPFRGARLWK